MTESLSPLERRLRERRYERALRTGAEILVGIGIVPSNQRPIPLNELESIWPRYLTRLRERKGAAEHWSGGEREAVQGRLGQVADSFDARSVVWLALVDSEPVGFEVPADAILRAALTYFVSE